MDQIARAIGVPREHKPTRLPTFPILERTSTLALTDTLTFSLTGGNAGYAFLVRDPVVPLWVRRSPHSGAYAFNAGLLTGGAFTMTGGTKMTLPIEQAYDHICYNSVAAQIVPSGMPVLPILHYQGGKFIPNVTGYYGIQFSFSGPPGATSVNLSYTYITSNMDIETYVYDWVPAAVLVTGNVANVLCPIVTGAIGYFVTDLCCTTTAGVTLNSIFAGQTTDTVVGVNNLTSPAAIGAGLVPLAMVPACGPVEAETVKTPWKSTRCNAAAALFSNVTAVMQKEGTVNAGRISIENCSMFDVSSWQAAISKVNPKDRYFGALENGLYSFTLPEAGSELYRDVLPFQATATNWLVVNFDLDKVLYFQPIIFSDLDATSGTTLAITLDRHIEFRCSSVLFPLGYSTLPLETYHGAQMALANQGVFYENPTHLAMLGSLISAAVRKMAPIVAPYAIGAAKAAGSHLLQTAVKKMGDFAQAKMVQTKAPPQRNRKPKPKAARRPQARVARKR
jgi:hypothetical protein